MASSRGTTPDYLQYKSRFLDEDSDDSSSGSSIDSRATLPEGVTLTFKQFTDDGVHFFKTKAQLAAWRAKLAAKAEADKLASYNRPKNPLLRLMHRDVDCEECERGIPAVKYVSGCRVDAAAPPSRPVLPGTVSTAMSCTVSAATSCATSCWTPSITCCMTSPFVGLNKNGLNGSAPLCVNARNSSGRRMQQPQRRRGLHARFVAVCGCVRLCAYACVCVCVCVRVCVWTRATYTGAAV